MRASLPPDVVWGRGCYRIPCLSEVIHVLASRSWWGCKGGEGGGRATAAHRRGVVGLNDLLGEKGGLLEAVDFELFVLGQANFSKEVADIPALVSLKLDHFTILWVLNHCPIARKLLLEGLD